jgi:hypothetical protein
MPTIADFTVVQDGSFALPGGLLNDREFLNISFPALSTSSPAVLFFRVDPVDVPVRLVILMNDKDVLSQTFDTTQQRTWHEVIGPNVLKPSGNTLSVAVLAEPDVPVGRVALSDIVVMFQANIP